MANILLAYQDRIASAVVSAASELTTLPGTNLKTVHIAEKWSAASTITSTFIDFDFGATVTVDVLALMGTNLSSSATHRIMLDASVAGGTAGLDTGATVTGVSLAFGHIFHVTDSTVTARYLRWHLSDSTLGSAITAGRAFVAPKWTPTKNHSYGWGLGYVDPSRKTRSVGGQVYTDERTRYRFLQFTLDFMGETEMYTNAFEIDRLNGLAKDILVMIDHAGTFSAQQSVLGQIADTTQLINTQFQIFQKRYLVEERL